MKIFSKFLLFVVLMNFIPSLYIIFVAGGFLPPVFYLYFLMGAIEQVVTTMWLIHLIIYTVIFFALSYFIIEFIYKKYEYNKRIVPILSVVIVVIIFSFLPIYSVGGHSSAENTNIVGAYKTAGRVSYLPW